MPQKSLIISHHPKINPLKTSKLLRSESIIHRRISGRRKKISYNKEKKRIKMSHVSWGSSLCVLFSVRNNNKFYKQAHISVFESKREENISQIKIVIHFTHGVLLIISIAVEKRMRQSMMSAFVEWIFCLTYCCCMHFKLIPSKWMCLHAIEIENCVALIRSVELEKAIGIKGGTHLNFFKNHF